MVQQEAAQLAKIVFSLKSNKGGRLSEQEWEAQEGVMEWPVPVYWLTEG